MKAVVSVTVSMTETWSAAEGMIARLRSAGLHPLDLSVSTPLVFPGKKTTYPIEVPAEEAEPARGLLATLDNS